MIIIGHRGAAGLALENTRASFRAALKAGVDWIEFDVHATRDGQAVVMHDPNTRRLANKALTIGRTTYAQLRQLKLADGHSTIPTLAEALNVIDGQAKVNIELKSKGCAHTVVSAVEHRVKKGAGYKDFMVSSFSVPLLREVHSLNAHIPLALLHDFIRPLRFLRLRHLPLAAVGFNYRRLPARAIRQAQLHGLFVYVFTVNDPAKAQQLVTRGVQGIVTNYPNKF